MIGISRLHLLNVECCPWTRPARSDKLRHGCEEHFGSESRAFRPCCRSAGGGEGVLAKAGKPVARIVAYAGPVGRAFLGPRGQIWIAPDFDVLPDDMAEAFGMKESGD